MKKIWMLCISNLRKGKGQAVTFLIIILLASFLLNIGLVIYFNYNNNFGKRAEEFNAADILMAVQNVEPDVINPFMEKVRADKRTLELEKRSVLVSSGTFLYSGGEMSKVMVVLNEEDHSNIGKMKYVEKSEKKMEKPVYLPWLLSTGGGYKVGDDYTVTLSTTTGIEKKFTYQVAGFFEETYLATIYSTMTGILLEPKEYQELSDFFEGSIDGTMLMGQISSQMDGEKYVTKYFSELTKELSPLTLSDSIFWELIKQSRTITSSIGAMIIVAFAIIIVIVALIIVKFRIDNHIEEDMPNFGALKAIGYTSRQIIGSILMQFSLVSAVGGVIGISLSYAAIPFVSNMLAAQTGIIWEQGFDAFATILCMLCILLMIQLVSLNAAAKIKRLHPIVALRGGIMTHSFKWNPLPLVKMRGNLILRLSGKLFFQNSKQNIMVGIIISVISFVAVFSGVLYYNICVKDEVFLSHTSGEDMDIVLKANSFENSEKLLLEVRKMPKVEKAIYYENKNLSNKEDGTSIMGYVCEDFSKVSNKNVLIKGRFPKQANEIAIGGLLAKKLNKEIGDTLCIAVEDSSMEYLISGFLQSSNYLGRDACLTTEGYKNLVPDYWQSTISVYLTAKEDADKFIETVKKEQGDKFVGVNNYWEMIESSMGVYKKVVSILVWVILFITILVIILTLFLIVKTLLLRKKKEMGIQKALGFTTGQLILQTACGFLPVLLIGTIVGCLAGGMGVNSILSILFSGIGILKVNFIILPGMLVGLCAGITWIGFVTVIVVSGRIRKISPYTLMNE